MKKIFYLLIIGMFMLPPKIALADGCATGYACLLKDLDDQNEAIQEVQRKKVNKYYNPDHKGMGLKEKQEISYKEILPFQPKYYLEAKE